MRLIIYYNNSKCKQIINFFDNFLKREKGEGMLTHSEISMKVRDLVHDITQGNYLSYELIEC